MYELQLGDEFIVAIFHTRCVNNIEVYIAQL